MKTNTTTERRESKHLSATERRLKLSDLSKKLVKLRNYGIIQCDGNTVNALLLDYYEKNAGRKLLLKTFEEWRKEGYFVRRGEKAFDIWGKKISSTKDKDAKDTETKETKELKDFFPLCHLFDISQCEKK